MGGNSDPAVAVLHHQEAPGRLILIVFPVSRLVAVPTNGPFPAISPSLKMKKFEGSGAVGWMRTGKLHVPVSVNGPCKTCSMNGFVAPAAPRGRAHQVSRPRPTCRSLAAPTYVRGRSLLPLRREVKSWRVSHQATSSASSRRSRGGRPAARSLVRADARVGAVARGFRAVPSAEVVVWRPSGVDAIATILR